MVNFRRSIPLIVLPIAVFIAVYHGKLPVEKQGQVAGPFHDIKVTPAMLDDALSGARTQHKLLMVEFGGNWCGDCLALSRHQFPPNSTLSSLCCVRAPLRASSSI